MPDNSLERIVQNLVFETKPRTIQLRVTTDQPKRQIGPSSDSSGLVLEQTYFETDRGERYFDDRMLISNRTTAHKTSYCDGKRCANVSFSPQDPERQNAATIGHNFMNESTIGFRDAPYPLRLYHVGLERLYEALTKAEPQGQEVVIDRTCDNFEFKGIGPPRSTQSLVYSLDRETSVPLKISAFRDDERRQAKMPNWIWEAKTLDKISGRHFALSSRYQSYRVSKSDSGQWVSKPDISKTIQVTELAFDRAISKSTFWPTFQPGVPVMDLIAKTKQRTRGEALTKQEAPSPGARIIVNDDSGSWMTGVGLALSLTALGAAAILWRRSR